MIIKVWYLSSNFLSFSVPPLYELMKANHRISTHNQDKISTNIKIFRSSIYIPFSTRNLAEGPPGVLANLK